MESRLELTPKRVLQLRTKVREIAERRAALYNELQSALRELAELADRHKRRMRQGDHEGLMLD